MAWFVLHSALYTNKCTESVSSALVTIADWQAAYRGGADPVELLGALRRRLAAREGDAALIALVPGTLLEARLSALAGAAAASPDRAALLAALPLWGVPFAIKDNIDIEGLPTTAACPAFAQVAPRSAETVRRLEAAGAVWIAKTNLDQFATGPSRSAPTPPAPAACRPASTRSSG